MIKDKTAILITHRLSAVQLADKVAVFDDGQIIEYGTHSELYSKGGKYREMFDKQAQFYVNAGLDDKEDDPINQTSNKKYNTIHRLPNSWIRSIYSICEL